MLPAKPSLLVPCLLAALLAGCQVVVPAPAAAPATAKAVRKPSAPAAPKDLAAADLMPTGGGSVMSNNGATLVPGGTNAPPPKAEAPPGAALIGRDGPALEPGRSVGLVEGPEKNDAPILAGNGPIGKTIETAGTRLAGRATDPAGQPAAGLAVALLDAAGQPQPGADGQALVARTDAGGAYAFPSAPRAQAGLLRLTLPAGRGELWAIATTDRGAAAVDLDLATTLVARGLLARGPASLDGLTRRTLAAARLAVAQAMAAPPARLDPDAATQALAAARAADPACEAAMRAVEAEAGL